VARPPARAPEAPPPGGLSQRQAPLSASPAAQRAPRAAPASLGRSVAWAADPPAQAQRVDAGARAGAKDAKGRTPLLLARQLERGQGDAQLLAMLEYAIQGQAPAVPMGHGGLV
jgi:hypothetical protein